MSSHSSFDIRNLSFRSLLIILVLVLIPIVVLLRIRQTAVSVSAAWFNDSWAYRQRLDIANPSGSNLTDFQVNINVGTSALIAAGKMQSSCADIRVTDNQGKILPHWIEENNPGCNQLTDTKIWVKVPALPSSGATLYLYYGNPTATDVQNGNTVFDFFDDFNRSTLDTSKWTTQIKGVGGSITLSSDNLILAPTTNTISSVSLLSQQTFTNNVVIETRRKQNSNNDYMDFTLGSGSVVDSGGGTINLWHTTLQTGYYWFFQQSGNASNGINIMPAPYQQRVNIGTSGFTLDTSTFKVHQLSYSASGQLGWSADGTVLASATDTTFLSTAKSILITQGEYSSGAGDIQNVDYIFVHKYASSSPTTSFATEENSPAPIAYWKFDEGVGTSIFDSTSNKNNGVFGVGTSIPTWVPEDQCISGKCLYFNGSTSYLELISPTIVPVGSTSFTIESWFKTSKNTGPGSIFGQYNSLGHTSHYFRVLNGHIGADEYPPSGGSIDSNKTISDSLWHHVVYLYSGTTWSIYIDGIRDISGTAEVYNGTAPTKAWIGNRYGASGNYTFSGYLDELKIYKYARTLAQIQQDYNAGKAHAAAAKGAAAALGNNKNNSGAFSEGLVGYWKFDENVGTSTADSSGNNNTGVFGSGTSAPAWSSGKYGVGLSFAAANGQMLNVGSSINLVNSSFTLSAFAKRSSTGGQIIIAQGTSSTDQALHFGFAATNTFECNFYADDLTTSTVYTDTNWHHWVCTYDAATKQRTIYQDGLLVATAKALNNYIGSGKMYLATSWFGSSASYDGLLDDVRVYNRALSPAEVSQLYNYAPGPVAYWKFDEGTGTTAFDSSGNGLNAGWQGTLGNQWTNGKYGKSGNFNGSNNFVQVPNTEILNSQLAYGLTISAWVKPNLFTTNSYETIVAKSTTHDAGGCGHQYGFVGMYTTAQIRFFLDTTGGALCQGPVSTGYLPTNQWSYITGTYDSLTGKAYIYINGKLDNSATLSGPIDTDSSTVLKIGKINDAFNGQIDDVKIYNYARTQKQVVEDMNGGHPVGGSPVGSQVGYWKFDEGYGTITQNWGNAGVGASAALSGAVPPAWTNDGKFQKALNFNGSSSRAAINSSTLGDLTSAATVSMWVNPLATNISGLFDHYTGGNGNTGPFYLWWSSSKFRFSIANGTTSNNVFSPLTYATNNWYYVAGSFDGTTVKLYVNGSLVASASQTITPLNNSQSWNIGSMATTGFFNGLIDEVKVYNSALTDDEVKLDYNNGKAIVMGSLSSAGTGNTAANTAASQEYCVPGDASPCAGPVARWDFQEGSGTTAYDSSGNSNNAIFGPGSSAPSWAQGKVGTALNFDGQNDYVWSTSPSFDFDNNTVEAWIYPTAYKTDSPYVSQIISHGSCTKGRLALTNTGAITYQVGDATVCDAASTTDIAPLNQWSFITGVRIGNTLSIYINGKLSVTRSFSLTPVSSTSIFLGNSTSNGTSNFTGKIDQVRLYSYARTPAQIALDYNRGKPIAWYKFDECQGSNISDWSMNGNTGILSIGPSGSQNIIGTCSVGISAAWTNGASGKWGSSLNFDGTDDYVATTSPITIGNSFSYAFWVKVPASWDNSYPMAIGFRDSYGSPTYAAEVIPAHAGVSNKVHFQIYKAGWISVDSLAPLTQGWHHIVAAYNSTTATELLYIDGTPNNSSPGPASFAGGTSTMYFGATIGGVHAGYMLKGQLDDVRIYNYALTSEQVKQVYNNGSVVNYGGL